MKRIAALITVICCLLTAVSAFAEVTAKEAAVFDAFTFTAAEGAFLQRTDPSTGVLFQYFPRYAEGDTGSSIICQVIPSFMLDPMKMTEQDKADFVGGLVGGLTNALQASGAEVTGTEVTWDDPAEIDGVPGVRFSITIDVSAYGMDLHICETGVMLRIDYTGYVFVSGGTDAETADAILDEMLATLTWN